MADILDTTQQVVLSVRMKGDATGPQTGDVVLGANILNDWSETEAYEPNEMVVKDGVLMRAISYTEAGEFDPDDWERLTDIVCKIANWEPNHEYLQNEVVKYGEHLYRAPVNMTSESEFNPENWEAIDSVNTIVNPFEARVDYSKYEVIGHNGKLYRAKYNFISGDDFNPNDWELISDVLVPDFQPNTSYSKDAVILSGGKLYRAKYDFTSGPSFDGDDWLAVSAMGLTGFTSNTFYPQNSVIYENGKLYVAKQDFTSTATFNPNDWIVASDTNLENYAPNTYYQKGKLVYYENNMYSAKDAFTSGPTFDRSKWILITGSTTPDFEPWTFYQKDTIICHNGILYRAKQDFTSDDAFDENDWVMIAETEQETYDRWQKSGTTVTVPEDFEEIFKVDDNNLHISRVDRVCMYGDESNCGIYNFDDLRGCFWGQWGDMIGLVAPGEMALISGGEFADKGEFRVNVTSNPEYRVYMDTDTSKDFTNELQVMSTTQKGVAKSDGESTKVVDEILSAFPIAKVYQAGATYTTYELVNYQNKLYFANQNIASAPTNFDLSMFNKVDTTVNTYTTGSVYSVGDIIDRDSKLYLCVNAMSSAPSTIIEDDWKPIKIDATNVNVDQSKFTTLYGSTLQEVLDVQDSLEFVDVKSYDNITQYLITTQVAGTTPPTAIPGKTIICLFTED